VDAVLKAVFAIKSKYNFAYVSSIVKSLNESGCEVVLFFDRWWSRKKPTTALREFLRETDNTTSRWMKRRSDKWRRWIFPLREILTYADYNIRLGQGQSPYYAERWGELWIPYIVPFKGIVSNKIIYRWLSKFERYVPPDRKIVRKLVDEKPDVVMANPMNHRFSEEVEYVKAAKSLGIPTVAVVQTWDNLTTKGLFHVAPDMVLVWNEADKRVAAEIHGIPKDSIRITGAPFFDKWFEDQKICKPLMDKPYILYLGSSRNIIKDERDLVRQTQKKYGLPMIVRPHPANSRDLIHIRGDNLLVMPPELPESKKQKSELYSVIHHCEFAVGVNTSAMIDVIIQDKPCIALKGYDTTQAQTIHFQRMLPALGVDGDRAGFVKKYIRPYEKSGGQMAAERIRELATQTIHRGV
jgi:hypothetical protein